MGDLYISGILIEKDREDLGLVLHGAIGNLVRLREPIRFLGIKLARQLPPIAVNLANRTIFTQ